MQKVLFIEPFYGGSHKTLIDILKTSTPGCSVVTLKAKKWHWRARCGALQLRTTIPTLSGETTLFCSSVVNLAELLGLRPDLQKLKKIVYFHENQLIYPVQSIKQRDVQYGYNEIISCLSADVVLFNSHFNRNSFLENIGKVLKLLPDARPPGVVEEISKKSRVLYFPIELDRLDGLTKKSMEVLHIVWPHRWEFDKAPEDFFFVLMRLKRAKLPFKVVVLGEQFTENPKVFSCIREQLHDEIAHCGFVKDKQQYYELLKRCHVVVSTAVHEFFGVSTLEATACGCFPIVPKRLVYPEVYPAECWYGGLDQLFQMLADFCKSPQLATEMRNNMHLDFTNYSKQTILRDFLNILNREFQNFFFEV